MSGRTAPAGAGGIDAHSFVDDVRGRARKLIRLSLILCLSVVVNTLFTASGLATAVALYTLLIYLLVLFLLLHVLNWMGIDQHDLRETFAPNVYPVRVRTPLHAEFVPYIAVWLAWWTITELFRAALVLYADSILWQFFFFPALVIFITWLRSSHAGGSSNGMLARMSGGSLLLLQVVTTLVLFFPTAAWAPQHNKILTWMRVPLYFIGVVLFDCVKPANTHLTLSQSSARARASVDSSARRMLRETDPMEHGIPTVDEYRRDQIVHMISAHECVANEHARACEIATLNAWILVSPFIVGLIGLICTTVIFFVGAASRPSAEPVILQDTSRLEATQHYSYPVPPPEYNYHQQHQTVTVSTAFHPRPPPLRDNNSAAVAAERPRVQRPQPPPVLAASIAPSPPTLPEPAVSSPPLSRPASPAPVQAPPAVKANRRPFQQVGL